jgi:hypothetical protein
MGAPKQLPKVNVVERCILGFMLTTSVISPLERLFRFSHHVLPQL